MKRILALVFVACLGLSCTSHVVNQEKKKRIAMAVKTEGDVFQSQGNYTAALAKHLAAEELDPDNPAIQNSLGLAYMGKKRYDLAEQTFARAVSLKPDYTEAKNNLGAAYLRQEKWDIAISTFRVVLEDLIYPTPQYPLANLGWAYLGKGNFANAQRAFLKSLDQQPDFITAHHGIALLFIRTGQIDRSIKYLKNQLRSWPKAVILHADLAEAYEIKGMTSEAKNAWRVVLKLSGKNTSLSRKAQKRLRNF